MNRLLFEKTGRAIYLSHLDTMALFPRVFLRAGLHVKFTQGCSPHAYVSIALPLSVGMASRCELLDFTLQEDGVCLAALPELLHDKVPTGIHIREGYDSSRKIKELAYLRCHMFLEYDDGVPADAAARIQALFARPDLVVAKKTKKGLTEMDIRPMLRAVEVQTLSSQELLLDAVLSAQDPALNPKYLMDAVARYLPDLVPSFFHGERMELYDANLRVFR